MLQITSYGWDIVSSGASSRASSRASSGANYVSHIRSYLEHYSFENITTGQLQQSLIGISWFEFIYKQWESL